MKRIELSITPECRSDWGWLAVVRWWAAAAAARAAFLLIDLVVFIADDVDIQARTHRAGRWEE